MESHTWLSYHCIREINVVELKIRKNGLFYDVFNEDVIILHYLFGYKIKDNRVSFPNNALFMSLNVVLLCL